MSSHLRAPSIIQRTREYLNQRKRGQGNSPSLAPLPEDGPLTEGSINEKHPLNGAAIDGANGNSSEAVENDALLEDKERRRYVRTLPHAHDKIVAEPGPSHIAQHHYQPAPSQHKQERGRKWDHARSADPVIINQPLLETGQKWKTYWKASAYGRAPGETGEIVDEDWLKNDWPDLDVPWKPEIYRPDTHETVTFFSFWFLSSGGRHKMSDRALRILMRNPFVPLVIRLTVMIFVAAALALGAWIYRESNEIQNNTVKLGGTSTSPTTPEDYVCQQQTSTYMAFIVDSVAIVYLFWVTYDEYKSKPLGLRRTRDKLRLIFLDLLFIVFSAANLSLAFNTLTDHQWSCYQGSPNQSNSDNSEVARSTCVYDVSLCRRQRALCSVLTFALFSWVMTFAISIARVVERLSR